MERRIAAALLAAGSLAWAPGAWAMAGGEHDHSPLFGAVQVDELEWRWRDGRDLLTWEAMAWYGGDTDKLVLRTEGEKPSGEGGEEAEVELLWSRMLDDFWNLEAGLRHDIRPRPQTTSLALGLVGLAPLFIET